MDEEPLLFRFALRVPAEDELLVEGGLGQIVNNMIAVVSSQQLFMLERRQLRWDRSWIRFLNPGFPQSLLALWAGSLCGIDVLIAVCGGFIFLVLAGHALEGIEQFLPLQPI